ncbi:VOC family protein [Cellulomonas sp. Leaf395]|uniref:VOC family protein n=1 Tax=Cellulomonas sp. Leaf395 TaxID=1736362 RepID=UPI0006F36085|nr:VOC family protein [Cellulomonas sp. Leaf395]KQT01148.1 3-demethylubiquinone-9 3-methyltransferase [Cellulomonas sp. Leaf395]
MQTISPFLWFDGQAEQAAERYVEIFPNSHIVSVARYGEGAPQPAGTAMSVSFVLDGVEVQALNGGPLYSFTEAFSFYVNVPDQAECDRVWDALIADGGEPGQCGWLKDQWGLSWQVIPEALPELLSDPDPGRAGRALNALLTMTKIDVAALHAAADAAA